MKKIIALFACLCLICAMTPAVAETPAVTGAVLEIEQYGHARLDITIEDFEAAGFDLGDIVTVTAGSFTGDMPYLNGYYVDAGEYMLRAYPGHTNIAVCINYGKFAEAAGVDVGDQVSIALREKAGALTLQEINNLVYANDIDDYGGDEAVFANFRAVEMGGIARGRLYRSASPILNTYARAATADRLIEAAGVKTVMNLANTEEEIAEAIAAEDFDSPYYASLYEAGSVIVLGLPVNYASDEFGEGVVRGFTFLSEGETPFLVHCMEGKDRAGFAAMLLEMLAGAPLDDIVADYMTSYVNYYGVEEGSDKYNMIAEKNVMEMMRAVCGLDKGYSLDGVDLKAGARAYLSAHGMAEEAIDALIEKLVA